MQWTNHFKLCSQQQNNFFSRVFSWEKRLLCEFWRAGCYQSCRINRKLIRLCVCMFSVTVKWANSRRKCYLDDVWRSFVCVGCVLFSLSLCLSLILYLSISPWILAFRSIQFGVSVCNVCCVFLIPTRICSIELQFISYSIEMFSQHSRNNEPTVP